MGFKKTTEGRVFFQNSNNNEPAEEGSPERILEQNQGQLQILGLLRSLNERLQKTQEERDQFRRDMDLFREKMDALSAHASSTGRTISTLESQFTDQLERLRAEVDAKFSADLRGEMAADITVSITTEIQKMLEAIAPAPAEPIEMPDFSEDFAALERQIIDAQIQIQAQALEQTILQDLKFAQDDLKSLMESHAEELLRRLEKVENNHEQWLSKQVPAAEFLAPESIDSDDIAQILPEYSAEQIEDLKAEITADLEIRLRDTERKLEDSLRERDNLRAQMEKLEEAILQTSTQLDKIQKTATVPALPYSVAANTDTIKLTPVPAQDPIQAKPEPTKATKDAISALQDQQAKEEQASKLWRNGMLGIGGVLLALLIGFILFAVMTGKDPVSGQDTAQQGEIGIDTIDLEAMKDRWGAPQDVTEEGREILEVPIAPEAVSDPNQLRTDERLQQMMEENPDALAEELNKIEPGAVPEPPQKPDAAAIKAAEDQATLEQSPPKDLVADKKLPGTFKELEEKARAGNYQAQHDLAAIYTSGHGGAKQDFEKAFYWFQKASEGGIANANYNLGVMKQQGVGTSKDMEEAIGNYSLAADMGHPEAQYNLGIAYIQGAGVSYSPQKAIDYFEKAARKGIAEAAYNAALVYENGLLGSRDYTKARNWYEQAAAKGNAAAKEALNNLDMLERSTSLREGDMSDEDSQ